MNYLQKKKLAFMSIVNRVKGFVRTITGALPLTLEGCVDEDSIIDYTLYGQSVQNGTPTPETPIEVESVGEYDETIGKYKIPIKVSGKNLFDIDDDFVNKCFIGRDGYSHYKMQLKPNTTYAVSVTENNQNNYIVISNGGEYNATGIQQIWLSHKTNSSLTLKPNKTQNVTTTDNGLIYLCVSTGYNVKLYKTRLIECISGLQIEEGATATDYEPYHEPITTNIYLDEPLRKVSNYADYIDFENGKVIRNVKSRMLTSDLEWVTTYSGKTKNYYHYCYVNDITQNITNDLSLLCSHYLINVRNTSDIDNRIGFRLSLNGFFVTDNTYTNVEEFKSFIEANDIEVVYPSYSEETIELPPIPTFKGTSIISADTTVQPSNAEIEYYSTEKE